MVKFKEKAVSDIYFYSLQLDGLSFSNKMIILK